MPTTNFETTVSLPHTDCTEDNFYELCRTLRPVDGALVDGNSLKVVNGQIVPGNPTPYFRKYTKTASDMGQAAATFDIELFSLPPGGCIHAIKLKHSAAFTGGGLTAYTLSIGIAANLSKYMPAKNVFGAPGPTNMHIVWAPFLNFMRPASGLPIGASYSQAEITAFRDAFLALFTGFIGSEDAGAATSIRLAAAATGGNTMAATVGSVDVWVLYSILQ